MIDIKNLIAPKYKSVEELPYRQGTIGIVFDNNSNFLVVQMIDYDENDWRFPGGGVENGEKEEETILRELKEELGTDSFELLKKSGNIIKYDWPEQVIINQIKNKNRYFRGQTQTQFLIKFTGQKDDIKIDPKELRQIRWVKREELKDHLHFDHQLEEAERVLEELFDERDNQSLLTNI